MSEMRNDDNQNTNRKISAEEISKAVNELPEEEPVSDSDSDKSELEPMETEKEKSDSDEGPQEPFQAEPSNNLDSDSDDDGPKQKSTKRRAILESSDED